MFQRQLPDTGYYFRFLNTRDNHMLPTHENGHQVNYFFTHTDREKDSVTGHIIETKYGLKIVNMLTSNPQDIQLHKIKVTGVYSPGFTKSLLSLDVTTSPLLMVHNNIAFVRCVLPSKENGRKVSYAFGQVMRVRDEETIIELVEVTKKVHLSDEVVKVSKLNVRIEYVASRPHEIINVETESVEE